MKFLHTGDVLTAAHWNELVKTVSQQQPAPPAPTKGTLTALALAATASTKRIPRRALFGWLLGKAQ